MKYTLLAAAAFLLTLCSSRGPVRELDPLATARTLAEKQYKEFEYGSSGDKRIDCTQFVSAVVESLSKQCSVELTKEQKRTLAIVLTTDDQVRLQELVSKSDPKVRGVQQALIDASLGAAVEPKNAKSGDFVQYWYKTNADTWAGHAGLVEKIERGQATIFGSHKTTLQRESGLPEKERKGGVGSGALFDLADASRKVFVARWTKAP